MSFTIEGCQQRLGDIVSDGDQRRADLAREAATTDILNIALTAHIKTCFAARWARCVLADMVSMTPLVALRKNLKRIENDLMHNRFAANSTCPLSNALSALEAEVSAYLYAEFNMFATAWEQE